MSGLRQPSSFLDALSLEIQKKLQRALNSPSQRPEILHELFKDLALEVDDRAKAKLQADITSSTKEDLISPADYDLKGQICFYDVLADHYLWVPECGKPILHLIVQLWSQSFASHIFSLLFHKWFCRSCLNLSNVTLDNSLSPAHTLLQIHCIDHKGLLYDILRTLKDCSIKIAFSRFSPNVRGYRDVDLFIQQVDRKKILHPDEQNTLCSRLKIEMLHPLRVIMSNRGPDAELLVANPVESSGRGRPRVFYDVTLTLKTLGICIFLAEIGRQSTSGGEWEVYRFVLDEKCRFELSNKAARHQIVDKVRKTLMRR